MTTKRSVLSSIVLVLTLFAVTGLTVTPVQAGIVDQVGQYADVLPKDIFQPFKPDQAPEIYGPTPINAQLGNQGLSIGIRKNGTVSTYSWPRPSMWDQVKFHTSDRGKEHWGTDPNSGQFLGLQVQVEDGTKQKCTNRGWLGDCTNHETVTAYDTEATLLRNWTVEDQYYKDSLNDVIVTEYSNDEYGLDVTVTDLVPINEDVSAGESGDPGSYYGYGYNEALEGDALIRKVEVDYQYGREDDPVANARLYSYSNFMLVGQHHPYVPTNDWAERFKHGDAIYYHNDHDGKTAPDALFHMHPDHDITTAMGFGKMDPRPDKDNNGNGAYSYQVGMDIYTYGCNPADWFQCLVDQGLSVVSEIQNVDDAYADFVSEEGGDAKLSNHDNHCPNALWCATLQNFQMSTAILSDRFKPGYDVSRKVVLANGENKKKTEQVLEDARDLNFEDAVDAKEEWFRSLLEGTPVPDASNSRIAELSKRSLVTMIQDYDPRSGAIVASIARQSPYAEDWPRDGAYFNYVLDHKIGLHDWVEKRNKWYADLQQKEDGFHLEQFLVPAGNWAMNYYGNGKVGGVIPWEVDETGYMVWAFWDHYKATQDRQYLEEIYPDLKRSADFLVQFEDENTGLQKKAHEDDHFTKSQTLVGANSTWMAMRSAENAAEVLGKTEDAEKYRERKQELGTAIDDYLWNAEREAWGIRHWGQAEIAWPTRFTSWDNERMQSHLETSWNKVSATFEQPEAEDNNTGNEKAITNSEGIVMGLYETKFLIPMAKAAKANGNTEQLQNVKDGLNWIADYWATDDTLIMGEVWMKCGEPDTAHPCDDPNSVHDETDQIIATVSQPHAWEQALFYLGAQEAYPTEEVDGPNSGGYGYYPGFGY